MAIRVRSSGLMPIAALEVARDALDFPVLVANRIAPAAAVDLARDSERGLVLLLRLAALRRLGQRALGGRAEGPWRPGRLKLGPCFRVRSRFAHVGGSPRLTSRLM